MSTLTRWNQLIVGLMAVVMLAGCATGGGGPSDEELITGAVTRWGAAMAAKDMDGISAEISEAFEHYEMGDKASVTAYISGLIDEGMLDDAEISMEEMEITALEDGKFKAAPVYLDASFGGATLEFELTKEADGVWRVTSMDVETY